MVPLNLLPADASADYIDTGVWSRKAFEEAERVGRARIAASAKAEGYARLPDPGAFDLDPSAAYLHITSNNTISGTQWHAYPHPARENAATINVPLICDMSSDLLSRNFDVSQFGLIYACAQKNLGPAGLTVVIMRDDLIESGRTDIPRFLQYRTHAKADSLYHTPNTFGIYVFWRHLQHIRDTGGLKALEEANRRKQARLYRAIDESEGFYRGTAEPASRSWMNVTMRLADQGLEARFLEEAAAAGLVGLKGHRSVGGIRASLYNGMSLEGVERLVGFMVGFAGRNAGR
jgi:phosphoserine aminotransferase